MKLGSGLKQSETSRAPFEGSQPYANEADREPIVAWPGAACLLEVRRIEAGGGLMRSPGEGLERAADLP